RFVPPGEKLHANAFGGFENAALVGRDETRVFLGVVKERKKIGVIKARDASERGNRSAHLAAFERTEEADGNARGAGNLRQGQIPFLAETAEALTGRKNAFCRNGDNSLALEDVNDGGRIQAARAA